MSGEAQDSQKVFGHFLQSAEWEKFQQAEGFQTRRVEGEGFRAMAVVHETRLGRYLFCPYGPELWQAQGRELSWSLEQALSSLARLAREEGAMFVRVEPTAYFPAATLEGMGLVRSHEIDPEHTWIIDLTCSQEDLLAGFEKSKVRVWKHREEHGIKVRSSQNPEEVRILTEMLAKLGEKKHFTPLDEEHLRRQIVAGFATLYIAEVERQPAAAAIVMDHEGVRYALHAAENSEYRKLRPGTVVGVEKIVDAQRRGLKKFDFWGITTSTDPKHPWYGFTQFKKSFRGTQVDYSGTWDLPISKVKYRIYQGLRALNRRLRKK